MVDIATLQIEVKSDGVPQASDRLKQLTSEGERAERATDKLGSSFGNLANYIKAAAAALGLWKLAEYIKDATLLAARYETLGAAMNVVGNNAGYTARQMAEYQKELQKTGIAMIEARESLTRMASAHMDLSNAAKLARIAQDAAVIGGINSSEAFSRMVSGIQRGETEILKTIGINVNFENSYKKLADQLGKTSKELTETEKVTARTNAVMEQGTSISGAYEAAMGTAGKQLLSMQRYMDNLKVVLGSTFNDALIVAVAGFTEGLKDANTEAERLQQEGKLKKWGEDLVKIFAFIADGIRGVLTLVATLTGAVIAGMQQLSSFGGVVASLYRLDFKGAWGGMKDMKSYGDAYVDDMRQRWGDTIDNSFQGQAERMYAGRAKQSGNGMGDVVSEAMEMARASARARAAAAAATGGGTGSGKGGADSAEQWCRTYADLRKEIELLTPGLDEYAKKVAEVSNKYTDLMSKKGADIVLLQRLREEHLKAIEVQRQIDQTSKEFKALANAEDEAAKLSQAIEPLEDWNRSVREMVAALDPAVKKEQEFSNGLYDIGRAFDENDIAAAADAYTNAFFKLAEIQTETADMKIDVIDDPYERQRAIIEKTYNFERDEIEKNLKILKAAGKERTDIYKALLVKQTTLNDKYAKDSEKVTEDETRSKLSMVSNYAGLASGLFSALADTQDQTSRKGFEAAKAFNIASAVMSTAAAVMNALATVQPYPLAIVAAASAAATGVIQIAKIASTTFGGGGGSVASVPGFSGGGAGMGGSVGGGISAPTLSVTDRATEESMQRLANSADSASLALGRVADGMTSIADLFESDQSKLLSGSLMSSRSNATGLRITGTESSLNITQQLKQNLGGTSNAVGQGLYDTIQGYIRQIQGTIIRSAVVMGTTADMDSISIPTGKIRTDTNQSTKIQKQFEEWLAKVADKLAQTTEGLKDFTYYGESAFDAIVRLATALQTVNEKLDLVGATIIASTLAGADAAYNLQTLMGGAEDFADKMDEYFETMFTEEEQNAMKAAQAQQQLTAAFNEMNSVVQGLNWTVPTTRSGFVNLANSLDLSTDNGRALFAALMDVVPQFGIIMDQMDELAEKAVELARAQDELNDSLAVRALNLAGKGSMADLLSDVISAENEIRDAREQGLDVALLEKIAYEELAKSINDKYLTAADNYDAALSKLNESIASNAKTLLNEWKTSAKAYQDIAASLKQARLSLMTGNLSSGSLEDRVRESKSQLWNMYGEGMRGDQNSLKGLSSAVNSYLQLAQQYYASSPGYAAEYDTVMGMLQSAEGKAASQIDYAQRQAELQQKTIDQLQKSDEARAKENAEQLKENVAQTRALMEGFSQMIAILGKSGGNLEAIESILVQKAAA